MEKLGQVCSFLNRGISPKYLEEGGVCVLNQKCIRDHTINFDLARRHDSSAKRVSAERLVQLGDVLINSTGTGTLGRVAQLREAPIEPTIVDSHVTIARPLPGKFFSDFFGYMLIFIEEAIKEAGEGCGGQTELARSVLAEKFSVAYPSSHSEQHRIVAILDEAFDGIATAKANAEKNLQNARALFESHLQSVFTERGEGWVEASIGDICTLKSGTSVSVSLEKSEGEILYVKVSDMTYAGNDTEIVASSRYLDMADIGKNAVFPTGTTIFPKRGGAILTNKKRLTALPICADLNIMGVIPPSNMLPRLLYFYFLNIDMRLIGSGSSIPQINNYDIAPLKISFPKSQGSQENIVRQLEGLAEETKRLESLYQQKLAALDDLKKSLLHQAFSG